MLRAPVSYSPMSNWVVGIKLPQIKGSGSWEELRVGKEVSEPLDLGVGPYS
jgi:hypothetical protein